MHEGETREAYFQRVNDTLRNLKQRMKHLPLAVQVCHAYFGWAGHVGRLPESRIVRKAVAWRDLLWFRVHSATDELSRSRPLLARPGRPARWEDHLEAFMGTNWVALCADRGGWAFRKTRAAVALWSQVLAKRPRVTSAQVCAPHISRRLNASFLKLPLPHVRFLSVADNLQVVQQTSGRWHTTLDDPYRDCIERYRWLQHAMVTNTGLKQWAGYSNVLCHVPRRFNHRADRNAYRALEEGDFWEAVPSALKDGDIALKLRRLLKTTRQQGKCRCVFGALS
jgi:hypothetical protein